MIRSTKKVWSALAFIVLAGCTNDFERFYRGASFPPPPAVQPILYTGEPRFSNGTGDLKTDIHEMYSNSYGIIGASMFTGPLRDQNGATRQAKKIGAEVIVFESRYRNTVSGTIPLTLPTANTSYSSGTVSAFGAGGSASGTYSGTTTTYGTQTTYIPYSVDKYNQAALYFVRLERTGFGAW